VAGVVLRLPDKSPGWALSCPPCLNRLPRHKSGGRLRRAAVFLDADWVRITGAASKIAFVAFVRLRMYLSVVIRCLLAGEEFERRVG
jgi:hypothetical protein